MSASKPADSAAGARNTLADGDEVEVQGSTQHVHAVAQGRRLHVQLPGVEEPGRDDRPAHLQAPARVPRRRGRDQARRSAALAAARPRGGDPAARAAAAARRSRRTPRRRCLLAHKWEIDHDPTGWWMSEKLDGVRAYWDGEAFVSRLGNQFFAPDWFVADLPADTLDGELWVGRKKFQRTIEHRALGRRRATTWKEVTLRRVRRAEREGRASRIALAHAQKVLARAEAPHARWHEHVRCARASITCARSSRASRRSAARA